MIPDHRRSRFLVAPVEDVTASDWALIDATGIEYTEEAARKSLDGTKVLVVFDYVAAQRNPESMERLAPYLDSLQTCEEILVYLDDPANGFVTHAAATPSPD